MRLRDKETIVPICHRAPAKLRPACALLGIAFSAVASAQALFPGDASFTPAQTERGQAAYALNCQSCHSPTLEGTQFGPALKGSAFAEHWRGRTRAAFSEQMRTTMPPG